MAVDKITGVTYTDVSKVQDVAVASISKIDGETAAGGGGGGGDVTISLMAEVSGLKTDTNDTAADDLRSANDDGANDARFSVAWNSEADEVDYITSTSESTDAASSGATQLLGIPLGASATKHGVLLEGFARIFNMKVTGAPSIGAPVYVDTTAGRVALTKPSGSGHFVRVIGYCVDFNADGDILLYFNPDATSIELS